MPRSARDAAVAALIRWEQDKTYSGTMLDAMLRESTLSDVDAAFMTRLVYGVIERLLTIDWVLSKNSRQPLKKCHPSVRAVLRVGAYQLLFMEKIPPSAAVNEAVDQAKRMRQAHAAGFVNGVLRAVEREGVRLLQSLSTDLKSESLRHSVPLELLQLWKRAYGQEMACALAASANEAPPSFVRVNTLLTTVEAFCEALTRADIAWSRVKGLPAALQVKDAARLRTSPIADTMYYFQDLASQWACEALDARVGERIADVCAAPGGKSFTTAMRIHDRGELFSYDVYAEKVSILVSRAQHYGISCLSAAQRDASTPAPSTLIGMCDRVICDVPCSGYGVIRRRPEIRYKPLSDFVALPDLQYRILCEAASMVREGGVLQYSTCTLRPEENEEVVKRFLSEHPDFVPRELPLLSLFEMAGLPPSHQLTLLPPVHGTDGFFIASFRRGETA